MSSCACLFDCVAWAMGTVFIVREPWFLDTVKLPELFKI